MATWIHKYFTAHPETVDETYFEHLTVALSFAVRLLLAGLACFVHALVPGLFVKTGSNMIRQLHQEMVTHRHRKPRTSSLAPELSTTAQENAQ